MVVDILESRLALYTELPGDYPDRDRPR